MKRQSYYYVLVLGTQNSMPKFVTKIEDRKFCRWELNGTPLAMTKEKADDIAIGLCWNGTLAYTVVTNYEISQQLKYYIDGKPECEE